MPIKRLLHLERKFTSDFVLQSEYKQLKQYLDLKRLCKVSDSLMIIFFPTMVSLKIIVWQLRVVFNGSAQSSSGWSFKDLQYVEPTTITDLFSILLQFRQYAVAVCVNIEKMYRQILIHSEDNLHNIMRKFRPYEKPIVIYIKYSYIWNYINYILIKFKKIKYPKYLAEQYDSNHPLKSKLITSNFYVDDSIASFSFEKEAIQLCSSIVEKFRID